MNKHVIFDFDGTLVDSLPVVIEIANQMVPQLNLNKREIDMLREMPAKEIIKYSGIPYWRLPRLLLKGKKLLAVRLKELSLFPGMADVLKQLSRAGYQISVVSSNSEEIIRAVLKHEGVEGYIAGVYGNVGLFSKSRAFKAVLKDKKAKLSDAVYLGDEVRDIESAQKTGLTIISVTWGYNGQKILSSYKPDYLATKPSQLVQTIQTAFETQ